MITRRLILGSAFSLPFIRAKARSSRASWMAGRWGIMVHWVPPGPAAKWGAHRNELNDAVNHFDLDQLVAQICRTKAAWVIFTLGQNSGLYSSPNRYLDSIAGPGHASSRDLVLEMAKEFTSRGIKLIVYAPGEIKAVKSLHLPFGWNPLDQSLFQQRYTTFLREYSERFAEYCSGWWIDGCYAWPEFPNSSRDWSLWAGALRAGNEEAALAFNDGCFLDDHPYPLTSEQDFLSGEASGFGLTGPLVKRANSVRSYTFDNGYTERLGCQAHVVAPLDNHGNWVFSGPGPITPPAYTVEDLSKIIENYRRSRAALTFNVGIYQEGLLGDETVEALVRLP